MRNVRFVIYTTILCLFITILAISCDYADPIPPIHNRIGTYVNTEDDFTITISDDAETIEITIPNNEEDDGDEDYSDYSEYSIATLGSNDMRLDFYASTNVRVIFDGEDFNTAYLYTNYYNDEDTYSTCTK